MRRCRQILVLAALALATAGVPAAGASQTVALPPQAAARYAGIVDLAAGPNGVFGALKGLGGVGYFGAVGFRAPASLDPQFGEGGYTTPFPLPWEGINVEAEAEAVATGPGGTVLVAGYAREGIRSPTSFSPLLARYTASGSLDTGFGAGGLVGSRPEGDGGIVYHDVAVEPDGTIIAVGGRNERQRGVEPPAGVVDAYRPDGSPEAGFGQAGRTLLAGRPNPTYTSLWGVELLPTGRILVAGYLNHKMLLARFLPNGQRDREFGGGDGRVTVDLHSGVCCPPAALAVGPDGRIVVGGRGGSLRKQRIFLARFRPSGGLDRGFGKRGVEAPFLPWRLDDVNGLAVRPNGAILSVGRSAKTKRNRGSAFAIFRNRPSGPPDRSFGKEGLMSVRVGRESLAGAALGLSDGSVLVGGSALFPPAAGSGPRTDLLLDQLDR